MKELKKNLGRSNLNHCSQTHPKYELSHQVYKPFDLFIQCLEKKNKIKSKLIA